MKRDIQIGMGTLAAVGSNRFLGRHRSTPEIDRADKPKPETRSPHDRLNTRIMQPLELRRDRAASRAVVSSSAQLMSARFIGAFGLMARTAALFRIRIDMLGRSHAGPGMAAVSLRKALVISFIRPGPAR